MEQHITFTELILVILYLGLPVFLLGRLIQWMRFRYTLRISFTGILIIWIVSQLISLIFTVAIWSLFNSDPMFHFICIPAVLAELFVLMLSIVLKKYIVKWA
jgi:hypothetical protein